MSSIFRRPDCLKVGNGPDAGMLRKLIRDRNCRPELRGILESLLHYLTRSPPTETHRVRQVERTLLDERNRRNKDQFHEEHTINKRWIPETCWSSQHKEILPRRFGRDTKAGDFLPRRLTTFQLLYSKFLHSTPEPRISHQRAVGSLSPSRAVEGNGCSEDEHHMHRRGKDRRESRLKTGNRVKDVVARFAKAELKGTGEQKMKPTKPRLIGRGVLLSSLMDKFETMATVCKGINTKCPSERCPGGGKKNSGVQGKGANCERESSKQNQKEVMKGKYTREHLQGHLTTSKDKVAQLDASTEGTSNLEGKNNIEQHQVLHQEVENHCSPPRGQTGDTQSCSSGADRKVQTACITDEEGLCSNLQGGDPIRGPAVAEGSTCIDSSSPKRYFQNNTPEISDSLDLGKTESQGNYNSMEDGVEDDPSPHPTTQSSLHRYVIPRVYRCNQTPSPRSARPPPTTSPLTALDTSFNTALVTKGRSQDVGSLSVTTSVVKRCCKVRDNRESDNQLDGIHVTHNEGKDNTFTRVDVRRTGVPQGFRPPEVTAGTATFEDETSVADHSLPQTDKKTPRPKYTTINYSDPSVKQTYKPKTIRFTDTFTF